MQDFNLSSHLDNIYATFPEADHRPMIGLTGNCADIDVTIRNYYHKQIVAAGGVPVIIPPVADKDVIINTLERLDAIILTGGADYNPLWAGEEPSAKLHHINAQRDLPELLITRLAYNRNIPMLGICRGIQTLAMALDGKVIQDISETIPNTIKHSQDADTCEPTHSVSVAEGSMLHDVYGKDKLYVNSFHHQAVGDCGPKFIVTAKANDGVVEAIESSEYRKIMGVQWHPECMGDDGQPLFKWLVDAAAEHNKAKAIHNRILTLDSHCDTPMFFPQGVKFDHRDSRILVDLHKMTEGHQDAVTMVAYLPQPKVGEDFREKVEFPVEGPKEYAELIFSKIEDIVAANKEYLSIARTPVDLYVNKLAGRKSIMLGIENGLALESDINNVKHFANRGIVYITLCHNGDNDICDSARGSNTHNGVSAWGEKVIKEMNAQGVMVDLSHAAEKSFYDALDISATPIVCSHSNCKSLCDHPRNLTDDQLRKLAQKGGVAQITLYHGFVCKDGEATILDAMKHLEHAISIMGIDHVGLGTDFDGDGGIRGLANSSELMNFTIELMRRRYSIEDMEKIWGGNWLRVMKLVQDSKL
ncbi:MAG: fused gamma-glutamyl-gamma-aminobutyrate hydrolase/peptidase [Prevotella sp.]|nr:fused gamma-glutamyl-gamma-aminobutyrate hydrolase/peptidase [Prevotella sp.]